MKKVVSVRLPIEIYEALGSDKSSNIINVLYKTLLDKKQCSKCKVYFKTAIFKNKLYCLSCQAENEIKLECIDEVNEISVTKKPLSNYSVNDLITLHNHLEYYIKNRKTADKGVKHYVRDEFGVDYANFKRKYEKAVKGNKV